MCSNGLVILNTLRDAISKRKIVMAGVIPEDGGDDAACETIFETEACDESRGPGAERRRFDFRHGRGRLRISCSDH